MLAPETGVYEFIVRTENGARLWVNDNTKPLVDAWVKSGKGHGVSGLDLSAGQDALIRFGLEFSKAKIWRGRHQDQERKPPPVKASIALYGRFRNKPRK